MDNQKYTIAEIWIYPIKSLAGIKVEHADTSDRGFAFDRRWVLIDNKNKFITQREYPEMALIQPTLIVEKGKLIALNFNHKINKDLSFVFENPELTTDSFEKITIWDDSVLASICPASVNEWFSNVLGISCKLAYMPNTTQRLIDPNYAITGHEITSFSDAYPYLILGKQSMALLNTKLGEALSISRFRANLIFDGGKAHDEDDWKKIAIGDTIFDAVKLCARCPITTINPETATKGKEPLKSLANYRSKNNKVYFGQNLLISKNGTIKVGDEIVLKK